MAPEIGGPGRGRGPRSHDEKRQERQLRRLQQILKADIAAHFDANAVCDTSDDFGAILGGVDMNAERSGAERRIDDPDHCFGDPCRIGIDRLKRGKALECLFRNAL
jgi:hypothetical protein